VRLELSLYLDINLSIFGDAIESAGFPSLFLLDLQFATDLNDFNVSHTIVPPELWTDIGGVQLDALLLGVIDEVISGGRTEQTETVGLGEFDIIYGQAVSGVLNNSDNLADTYRLTATAGDEITITLRAANTDSDLDTLVNIYDQDGKRLASNDDTDSQEGGLGIFDSRIRNFKIPQDGIYLIEATSVFVGNDGAYLLQVDLR
jgi:hypothetical protein